MTDHLSAFLDAVFRNCTSGGGIHLYAFKHDDSRRSAESQRVALTDLATMRIVIDRVARARSPSQVFSPPVCLFGHSDRTVTANVVEAPVIALELDDHPGESRAIAEAVLGPATIVVQSGGVTLEGEDKLHLYWRLTQPARTPDEQATLRAVRMQLIALTGGDSTGGPIVHPMRWPGSWHTKGESRMCIITENTDREISLADAVAAMAMMGDLPNVRPVTPRDGWKTATALTADELTRLAGRMPNVGLSWDDWNRTGMAFFDASHGSDEGLAAFHVWSEQDSRYDEEETEARWYHWHNSPPSMLGAGTLYHTAGEVQPRDRPSGEDMFGDGETGAVTVREPPTVTRAKAIGMSIRENGGFMGAGEQIEHFKGCVYVTSLDKILMPNGTLLNQSRFDARMGGHMFAMDESNEKTTKSAWEAFLKGYNFRPPIADDRCFRPLMPPMSLLDDGNRQLVNCYVPIDTPRVEGDVSPFLDWLARAYPDKRDQQILLNYLASLVQNPGVKFFWWPVLQSAEGTGKGFIMTLLMYCVGRQYSHLPNTSKLTRKGMDFNGWIENKLFLGLNEIYSAKRRDFLEELKTTVTDSVIPIEGKGIEEATLDNYANGVLFTNHPDGVPITVDMRRYCILYMALQTKEDILKAGMDARYFKNYWDWVNGRGKWSEQGVDYGYRSMNHYLRTFQLDPSLDPANLATTAPRTSSTDRAIKESLGRAEQEVMEAIDQEQPGFKGGWVSSVMLDRVLKDVGANVPRNKRKDMMKSLGFHYHPGLHEGRVNNPVLPDGGKPRLYIKIGHDREGIVGATAIADQYMKDQGA